MWKNIFSGVILGGVIAAMIPCGSGIKYAGPPEYKVAARGLGLPVWIHGWKNLVNADEGVAWAWIAGVTVDSIRLPAGPEGAAMAETPRVQNMFYTALTGWIIGIIMGCTIGGTVGFATWKRRMNNP